MVSATASVHRAVPVHRLSVEDVHTPTSQVRDREKARDYAAADVPEYWIVDLAARTVVAHRSPVAGIYEQIDAYVDGQSVIPLLVDAPPVAVSELLG